MIRKIRSGEEVFEMNIVCYSYGGIIVIHGDSSWRDSNQCWVFTKTPNVSVFEIFVEEMKLNVPFEEYCYDKLELYECKYIFGCCLLPFETEESEILLIQNHVRNHVSPCRSFSKSCQLW